MSTFMVLNVCRYICSGTANYHGICRKQNAFSEARGKWKCPWNLPTLMIKRYFKQRTVTVTALKPGRIPLHMQETCTKLVSVVASIFKLFSDWWNQFFLATIQTLKSGACGGPSLKIHRMYFVEQPAAFLPAKKKQNYAEKISKDMKKHEIGAVSRN